MSHQYHCQEKFNITQPNPGKDPHYDQQKSGDNKQDQNKNPSGIPNENQRHHDSDCK